MTLSVSVTLLLLISLFAILAVLVWAVIGFGLRVASSATARFIAGNLLLGVGALLTAQRGAEPDYVFYACADLAVLSALACFRSGVKRLLHQPGSDAESGVLLLTAALAYAMMIPGPQSLLGYALLFAAVALYLLMRTLQASIRGLFSEFGGISTALLSFPFILGSVVLVWRLLSISIDPDGAVMEIRSGGGPAIESMLWGFFTVLLLGNVSLMAIAVGRLLIGVRRLSERDALTGLWNRRAMEERIRKERSRLHRGSRTYSMAIVDLDHFKHLNDTLGHAAGDAALCHVARVLDAQMRSLDVLSRFGGEEFLILMPLTDRLGAIEAARRLQAALAENPLRWKEADHVLTASIGVAEALPEGDDATFRAADDALYRAKSNGRNCVECALPVGRLA